MIHPQFVHDWGSFGVSKPTMAETAGNAKLISLENIIFMEYGWVSHGEVRISYSFDYGTVGLIF